MRLNATQQIDTTGLSSSGIWVRRMRNAPSLAEEALSLAAVLQIWDLNHTMKIDHCFFAFAEVSSPDLQPTWVHLVDLHGSRADDSPLLRNHPLSKVEPGEKVRILAIVHPPGYLMPGALVESHEQRRMLWLQPVFT